jgi:hypothetical protein
MALPDAKVSASPHSGVDLEICATAVSLENATDGKIVVP